MVNKTPFFIIWLVFCTLITVPSFLAYADDDNRENRWYHKILDWNDDDDYDKGKHRKRKREYCLTTATISQKDKKVGIKEGHPVALG